MSRSELSHFMECLGGVLRDVGFADYDVADVRARLMKAIGPSVAQSESATISARGHAVRLHAAAGVLGPLANLTCHVAPDMPEDVVELRDSQGRVLGKIIHVGIA